MKDKHPASNSIKFIFAFLLIPLVVSAQNLTVESAEEILTGRQEVFREINARENPFEDSLWYHGRIYEYTLGSKLGTPYYLDLAALKGTITYQGREYEDLLLSYNLVMDELILKKKINKTNSIELVLNKYYVEGFVLEHFNNYYNFILHTDLRPIHSHLQEGFYELVYDDELKMLVRHKKILFFDAGKSDHYSYQHEKKIYLILDAEIHDVTRRRDFLNVFVNNKKSLKKYMRQADMNYEKAGTHALSALCSYSKSLP